MKGAAFQVSLIGALAICIMTAGAAEARKREVKAKLPTRLERLDAKIPVGEKMKFSVRWLGLEAGTAEVAVNEIVKIGGRDTYHIEVHVRSNKLIDLLWPVRHEHHSYVDVEHFHSLRYDKKTREGNHLADEFIEYDQVNHKGRYESRRSGDVKEMLIPADVQDEISCTFYFRNQAMTPGEVVTIPVNVDEKNWKLNVDVQTIEEIEVDGFGKIPAVRIEPAASFYGLFMRRGRAWGWMSADRRRIPLLMKTKIPLLGSISMVITEYEFGKEHIKG